MPEIEFLDSGGQRIEFHSCIVASWNPWPAGSSVQVFYAPQDPTNAELKATRGVVLFVIGVFSVRIVGFGSGPGFLVAGESDTIECCLWPTVSGQRRQSPITVLSWHEIETIELRETESRLPASTQRVFGRYREARISYYRCTRLHRCKATSGTPDRVVKDVPTTTVCLK
jgi:Protein of unknown function (DUF3592)